MGTILSGSADIGITRAISQLILVSRLAKDKYLIIRVVFKTLHFIQFIFLCDVGNPPNDK